MKYVTIKVLEETRRLLRLIAAQSGEQMIVVLQRLCSDEWERVKEHSGADRGAVQREAKENNAV
jgi:hypothetical protein